MLQNFSLKFSVIYSRYFHYSITLHRMMEFFLVNWYILVSVTSSHRWTIGDNIVLSMPLLMSTELPLVSTDHSTSSGTQTQIDMGCFRVFIFEIWSTLFFNLMYLELTLLIKAMPPTRPDPNPIHVTLFARRIPPEIVKGYRALLVENVFSCVKINL